MVVDKYFERISGEMCDFAPFYNDIAVKLPDNCVIAEVGVADGYSSLYMAHWLHRLNKKFTLYMIDSLDYGGHDQLNTITNHVARSGHGDNITIFPYSSLDASCKFPDNHFDFVFIDASHKYEETKADIRLWYHKLKDGCLLAGHDYNMEEVKRAVDEVIPEKFQRPTLYHQDGTIQQTFTNKPWRQVYPTALNLGVWAVTKKFYFKPL